MHIDTIVLFIFDRKKETAGGGVLEFCAFCLQVCQLAFQKEPKSIRATAILNDSGVDVDTSIELIYGDNQVGKIRINLLKDERHVGKIVGTKGQITVNKFSMQILFFLLFRN